MNNITNRLRAISVFVIGISFFALFPGKLLSQEADSLITQDSLKVKRNRVLIVPFAFYSPETKLALGIYPNYLFRVDPSSRPSTISTPFYYTTMKQISATIETEIYLTENRRVISGNINYSKWPNYFYGIGNDSTDNEGEEYTSKKFDFFISGRYRIGKYLYPGVSYEFSRSNIVKTEDNGNLRSGAVIGSGKGHIGGVGVSVSWDRRENIMFPESGELLKFGMVSFSSASGSEYDYTEYSMDLRKYFPLFSKTVMALQARAASIDGNPPFWAMKRLGDYLRGYIPMRFIDKDVLAIQAEYRGMSLWKRLGFGVFAGTAAVESEFSKMDSDRFRFAYGFGLRVLILSDENLNLRIDFGYGEDSDQLYIDVGEAF